MGGGIAARLIELKPGAPWRQEVIGRQGDLPILCFRRAGARAGVGRLYLSAGIHGDEPAGPLALIGLLEGGFDFLGMEVVVFPALAPDALGTGSRTNRGGVDLNRDYRSPKTDEVRAHVAALSSAGEFDLALCLHEDWEALGTYIYEIDRAGRPGVAETLLAAMAAHIDRDPRRDIDGHRAEQGIIRPVVCAADRPDWPEAIFLSEGRCRVACTCETPSGLALDRRVAAHGAAVRRACEILGSALRPM